MSDGSLVSSGPSAVLRPGRAPLAVIGVVLGLMAAACGSPIVERPGSQQATGATDQSASGLEAAAERSVIVSARGCGFAPPADGSGVIISADEVLTAAHVVGGSTAVTVARPGDQLRSDGADGPEQGLDGQVVAYDTLRDLAIIKVESPTWAAPVGPLRYRTLAEGDGGVIVAAAVSGDIDFIVTEKTIIEMDEVRGDRRSRRSGYLLEAVTVPGDSGSGLYDPDGYLAGLLFAVSTDDQRRSWATAADEIEAFIGEPAHRGTFGCNPDRSRLQRQD
ncbi:MAG: S1 family peptidase [Acidimicrobiales bacterium]